MRMKKVMAAIVMAVVVLIATLAIATFYSKICPESLVTTEIKGKGDGSIVVYTRLDRVNVEAAKENRYYKDKKGNVIDITTGEIVRNF